MEDMKLKDIGIDKFEKDVYLYYLKIFPEDERKPLELLQSSYEKHYTRIIEILYKNEIIGFMILNKVKDKGYAVLDYLAILPQYRNNKFGTKALQILLEQEKENSGIFIEIEKVGLGKDIEENLYDEQKKSYVRNTEDRRMDISLLGAVTPFNVFKPKEPKVKNTVESINLNLRTYTGGYQRYEQDGYMNGNPWPIANLWMTLYYLEAGEKKLAKETFDFVVKTAGKHFYLGEQVDNSTLKPNWVIGLGWSHAMFIIVLEKLYG